MKHKVVILFVISLFLGILSSAVPDWYYRSSDAQFIVGNGSAAIKHKNDLSKAISTATEDALQNISSQIYSEVRSLIDSREKADAKFSEQFYAKEVQISSCIKLCGYDQVKSDSDRNYYYVQLQIPRERMRSHYTHVVQEQIEGIVSISRAAKEESNSRKAQKIYQQLRAMREDLNRDLMILGFLQVKPGYGELLKEVPTIGEIEAEIYRLGSNRVSSFDELAESISEQLEGKYKGLKTYNFGYYEWGNSGFASQFSSDFSAFMRAYLEKRFGWYAPPSGTMPEITLFGEMISEGKQVCMFTRVIAKNLAPQTVISYLNPATIEHFGMAYIQPQEMEEKARQDKLLKQNAQQSRDLKIEVRTREFGKNLAVYKYDDQASLEVRANRACFVHVLYLEADGTKTAIYENFYIADDLVNQWVLVTDEIFACEPAGIEQVWVQASLKRLPELVYTSVKAGAGIKKVIREDLKDAIARTRGMKIVAKEDDYSEAFLTMTVVEAKQ